MSDWLLDTNVLSELRKPRLNTGSAFFSKLDATFWNL